MNLRCTYCQTPFSVGRMEKLAALQRMQAENLHHYDAFCPRCRRANSVSRERLEQFTPGWQEGLKTLEAEAAQIEKGVTEPVPTPVKTEPVPAPVEASRNRHSHKSAVPAPKAEAKPAAKPAAKAKPAATKTTLSPKGKPAAKPVSKAKPAAKAKKPAAKKK
jgi:hypothetical protein